MSNQQGDVRLFQTDDGGNISVVNGLVEMSGGLETSIYLALFGGNEDDSGRELNQLSWWGNIGEIKERQYRSKTQNLFNSIPLLPINLRRIEDAALLDLQYLIDLKIATSVEAFATIPAINTVNLQIKMQANGIETEINFTENWKKLHTNS